VPAMMSALSDQFKSDVLSCMTTWLERAEESNKWCELGEEDTVLEPGETLVELLDFEDYTHSSGYCETCYYETTYCKITAKTSEGREAVYHYSDDFTELVRDLVNQ
jgi:hypothetical protein